MKQVLTVVAVMLLLARPCRAAGEPEQVEGLDELWQAAESYGVEPDVGIALDVTANGDTPEDKLPAVKLGEGICVKIMDRGSISNPELVRELLVAGEKAGVPTQREVLPFGGTDAGAMQLTRGGVRVCTLSIPCRNVHSACEVIDLRDVEGGKKLLLAYLER